MTSEIAPGLTYEIPGHPWNANNGTQGRHCVVSPNGRWLLMPLDDRTANVYDLYFHSRLAAIPLYSAAYISDDLVITYVAPYCLRRATVGLDDNRASVTLKSLNVKPNVSLHLSMFIGPEYMVQFKVPSAAKFNITAHQSDDGKINSTTAEYTIGLNELGLPEELRARISNTEIRAFFHSGNKWFAIVKISFWRMEYIGLRATDAYLVRYIGYDGQKVSRLELPNRLGQCVRGKCIAMDDGHFCYWTRRLGGSLIVLRVEFGEEISIVPVAAGLMKWPINPLAAAGFTLYFQGENETLRVWEIRRPRSLLLIAHFAALASGRKWELPALEPIAPRIGRNPYRL